MAYIVIAIQVHPVIKVVFFRIDIFILTSFDFDSMLRPTVFFVGLFFFFILLNGEMRLRTRSFKCTASNKSVDPNFKCFAKSYSRNFTTINFDFNFSSPQRNTQVKFTMYTEIILELIKYRTTAGALIHWTQKVFAPLQYCHQHNV